ncbi:uncharacterized protein A1O9_07809 [Exophiala aquamarina CBS 119918]|uniref:Zn(2)-C6 fungal-type domain-containing protein n=1 Tax=Exophiala aquamarina CBS 119918 TaxID=1182545 RepID=A0A072PAE0_9EURO|nr:uncharacterized protein A1O9_07809 [Exophiala aquamarina CBS 119918]KEF56228.1 hypothetical protein A1O9_07809 [Exophiala aquamarina CBS 119918]
MPSHRPTPDKAALTLIRIGIARKPFSMDSQSRADQTCAACKKLKRKCDKLLPQCALCQRTGRNCEYTTLSPTPTAGDLSFLRERLADLEQRLATAPLTTQQAATSSSGPTVSRNDGGGDQGSGMREFPTALFLDIDCYKWTRMQMPLPSAEIPEDVLSLLTQDNIIVETSEEYFNTIHTWMPVISKKRLNLGIAVHHRGPDSAMLFLAMRLITSPPGIDNASHLYKLSKSFLANLEADGCASYLYLQALLLVALYEYSHAIYPAAWMTVGACARYVELLGLSCSMARGMELTPTTTWTEVEERRRLWWGVFILDRVVSIGNRKNFCLSGPPEDGLFPVDDVAWNEKDHGDVSRAQPRAISSNDDRNYPPFAQLCQAALLVESAIRTTWSVEMDRSAVSNCPALMDQIYRFMSVVDAEGTRNGQLDFSWFGPRAICRSAIFVVLDLFTCPEKRSSQPGYVMEPGAKNAEEISLQHRAMRLTKELADQIHSLVLMLAPFLDNDEASGNHYSQISPQLLDVVYWALATYYWFAAEEGDGVYRYRITNLRQFLEKIGTRWRLGHEYLLLARYHDSSMRPDFLSYMT